MQLTLKSISIAVIDNERDNVDVENDLCHYLGLGEIWKSIEKVLVDRRKWI